MFFPFSKGFIWLQPFSPSMNSKYTVCAAFVAMLVLLAPGCVSSDQNGGDENAVPVPTENLPEGFSLLAVINDSTPGVDMEDEISDFKGENEIGDVDATLGVYIWGEMGKDYDARVTVMECEDAEKAKAAEENYLTQPDFENPPFKGVDRFSTAIVNGHQVTEIREEVEKQLRYLYLWTNENVVVLVEGNGDRAASIELASLTGQ